jgi:hypothetical protein
MACVVSKILAAFASGCMTPAFVVDKYFNGSCLSDCATNGRQNTVIALPTSKNKQILTFCFSSSPVIKDFHIGLLIIDILNCELYRNTVCSLLFNRYDIGITFTPHVILLSFDLGATEAFLLRSLLGKNIRKNIDGATCGGGLFRCGSDSICRCHRECWSGSRSRCWNRC